MGTYSAHALFVLDILPAGCKGPAFLLRWLDRQPSVDSRHFQEALCPGFEFPD